MSASDADAKAVARVRAAAIEQTETYVRLRAGDLAALCRAAGAGGPLADHAAEVARARGADVRIDVHRDTHLAPLLAAAPA